MKKTVIIVLIAVLCVIALCLGIIILMTPDPVEPPPVDPNTPNSLTSILGIERDEQQLQERLMAIRTYQGEMDFEDILAIAQVGGLEYYELDSNSDDYLLITPFEINGKMTLYNLAINPKTEQYEPSQVVFRCNGGKPLPDNYSLLLRYSRPTEPQYQIDLIQEKNSAAYQISNMEQVDKFGKYAPVKTTQLVKQYIEGDTSPITESFGKEIIIEEEEN